MTEYVRVPKFDPTCAEMVELAKISLRIHRAVMPEERDALYERYTARLDVLAGHVFEIAPRPRERKRLPRRAKLKEDRLAGISQPEAQLELPLR